MSLRRKPRNLSRHRREALRAEARDKVRRLNAG